MPSLLGFFSYHYRIVPYCREVHGQKFARVVLQLNNHAHVDVAAAVAILAAIRASRAALRCAGNLLLCMEPTHLHVCTLLCMCAWVPKRERERVMLDSILCMAS